MVEHDWFWVGATVKQHKEKPTPLCFFSRNTALKKIKSLKMNIDWNLLWTMSKCLATQCLILWTLRATWVQRYYLKDTQLSHSFSVLTQSSEAHELRQTWEVKRVSSYTNCKENINEDGQRMSDIKWQVRAVTVNGWNYPPKQQRLEGFLGKYWTSQAEYFSAYQHNRKKSPVEKNWTCELTLWRRIGLTKFIHLWTYREWIRLMFQSKY